MSVIKGTQICIPIERRQAGTIITSMVKLLKARKVGQVSRRLFLVQWLKLRTALFLTAEYQEFRNEVIERCGGMCEYCHKAPVVHIHHLKPVAFFPHLAMLRNYAKGSCRRCHKDADRTARTAAQRTQPSRASHGTPQFQAQRGSEATTPDNGIQ